MPLPRLDTIGGRVTRTTWAPVDPPDLTELFGIYRIRRLIEPELSAKACLLHTDADLDELEASISGFVDAATEPGEVYLAHRAFHTRLLAPAATAWDMRVLEPLWEESDRCVRGWFERLGIHPAVFPDGAPPCRDLLASFRARDPDWARAASRRHLDEHTRRMRRFLGQGN